MYPNKFIIKIVKYIKGFIASAKNTDVIEYSIH